MKHLFIKASLFAVIFLACKDGMCADTSTTSLPYEDWLRTIQKSFTGPVAFSIAIIGIVSSGATLIFSGGELSRFMRSIVYLVMVMTLLVGANSLMTTLFNGATIDEADAYVRTNFHDSHKTIDFYNSKFQIDCKKIDFVQSKDPNYENVSSECIKAYS